MNRIKCVIAIILCSFYFVSRGQTSVSWETNLKKAVEKAKSEINLFSSISWQKDLRQAFNLHGKSVNLRNWPNISNLVLLVC